MGENKYRPYLGVGIGPHLFIADIDASRAIISNPSEDTYVVDLKYKIGFLLRGGIETAKFRLGLEYNFVLKSDIEIPNGEVIGTVDDSYFGLSIAYIIGGKKSGN